MILPSEIAAQPKLSSCLGTGEGGATRRFSPARNFTNPKADRAPEKHAPAVNPMSESLLKTQASGYLCVADLHAAHSVLRGSTCQGR